MGVAEVLESTEAQTAASAASRAAARKHPEAKAERTLAAYTGSHTIYCY